MTVTLKDYFIYLPDTRESTPWECSATACGCTRVRPSSQYPPNRHPVDHHFVWANGRILATYQLVFISEGQGWFESVEKQFRVEASTVFILFPGVWHRYAPEKKTGWTEHWIELQGPALDRARDSGLIAPEEPVFPVGASSDWLQSFERCHLLAQRSGPARSATLATMGLHMLSLLQHAGKPGYAQTRRIEDCVFRAQSIISQRCQQTLNMEKLARELGEGYSNFRQAFREITGLSPKQYHVQVRLQRAQDLLANSNKSVKEIASILGFDSPFHLSRQFKHRNGLAPEFWRRKLGGKDPRIR